MLLKGYVVRNGQNVEDIDSCDAILRDLAEENRNCLMLFIGDKPERDEDGFEEWHYQPNCLTLPREEWDGLSWKDEPVEVEIDIHFKDR
ncbi:MAG: hypothetical protein K9H48_07670 [Melioribacteraceae bacterium]|nr:hypothetical protein [Melioribacteraceae bacterium]